MAHIEDTKIVILDKKYIKVPERRSKSRLSPIIHSLMAFACCLPDFSGYGSKKPRERPRVNLVEEYELIQLKKSKLSKNDRDWIECEFNKYFIEVK